MKGNSRAHYSPENKKMTNYKLSLGDLLSLLITFEFLRPLRLNRKDPIDPPKMDPRVTRYVCLTCPNSCTLHVRGKIIRFRQVCPQFQDNDGRAIWVQQETVEDDNAELV